MYDSLYAPRLIRPKIFGAAVGARQGCRTTSLSADWSIVAGSGRGHNFFFLFGQSNAIDIKSFSGPVALCPHRSKRKSPLQDMSSAGRGDFTPAADGKASFDYSLLMAEDGDVPEETTVEESVEASSASAVDIPVRMASPGTEADGSWNTVHQKSHGHSKQSSISKSHPGARRPLAGPAPDGFQRRPRTFNPQAAAIGTAHHANNAPNASPHPHQSRTPTREYVPVVLDESTSVEVYDFPAEFRTPDIRALLGAFDGKYRIKWNNDTSCWAVFGDASDAAAFLAAPLSRSDVKVRAYHPSQVAPKATSGDEAALANA